MAENGNIIGESFSPSVKKQIETRQNKLKQKNRDQDVIMWSNSSTAFLRLSSCVNLDTGGEGANNISPDPKNPTKEQLEIQNYAKKIAVLLGDNTLGGSELARRAVLWNGLASIKETSPEGYEAVFKKGINALHPDSIWNNNAYGFGGNDMGYRPMPGLSGATLTYYNMGALKKAVIQAKVFNVTQLEIIDILYMRLGYNILLEWGHTVYMDNEGKKQTINNLNTIPFEMVFPTGKGTTKNVFDILEGIEEERNLKSNNYDAFFGQVSKFNWTFNEDGSYDVVIEAMSHGDIIESLKINNNYPNIKIPQVKGSPCSTGNCGGEIAPAIDLTQYQWDPGNLEDISLQSGDFTTTAGVQATQDEAIQSLESQKKDNGEEKENIIESPLELSKGIHNIEDNSPFKLKSLFERHFTTVKQKLKQNKEFSDAGVGNYEKDKQYIKYKYGISKIGEDTNQYYVELGILLKYIQNNLLIYNEEDKTPYIKIDTNPDLNYCLSFPRHFSSNPYVCIIPFKYGLKHPPKQQESTAPTATLTFNVTNSDNPTPPKPDLNVKQETEDINYNSNMRAVTQKVTRTTGTQFLVPNNPYVGKLMHIHVNIDYLIGLMERLKDEKGEVNLFNFLQTTMNDISSALGNINNFNVTYDTETNYLKIYDNNNLNYLGTPPGQDKKEPAEFESYGISKELGGSFLKSINFTVTINNSFAQLVTIGAQANSNVSGINSTGLNSLNKGLIDRVFPKKVDVGNIKEGEKEPTYDVESIMKAAYSIYVRGNLNNDNLRDISVGHTDFCKDEINAAANLSYIPSPFFLPFTLKTTMLGLSGMKNYQRFRVQEDILPSTYKTDGDDSKIEFIARGVTHEIKDNKWISTLDAITVPVQRILKGFKPLPEFAQDFSIEPPTGPPMSIKLQAILDTIAWAEETIKYGRKNGYNVLFGGNTFNELNDHPWNFYPQPEKVYFDDNGVQNYSTAAGRYQFLQDTWNPLSNNNGLRNFGPANQDIGAILLATSKPNFLDSLGTEDYEQAFTSIKSLWASLPAAGYGQPEKKMTDTLNYLENRLIIGNYLNPEVEMWIEQNKPNILAEGKTS